MPLSLTLTKSITTLLKTLEPLLLASLVWLEQNTSLVLKFFALYDEHPHAVQSTLFATITLNVLFLMRLYLRPALRPTEEEQKPDLGPNVIGRPPGHRRIPTPRGLPGMDFKVVRRKWKAKGMKPPLVAPRLFGVRGAMI
jgi:hypothetical protein